jgi:chromosomal replication initiation ATPase DnaA
MLSRLQRLVAEIGALHSKLILLIGPPRCGKTALLDALAQSSAAVPLGVGLELGKQLAAVPQKQRHLQAATLLRELADRRTNADLLLIDNIELLFDKSLMLDPLDLLKRLARTRRVVVVWPGEWRNGRLTYAEVGHPEQRDYGADGWVPFEIQP